MRISVWVIQYCVNDGSWRVLCTMGNSFSGDRYSVGKTYPQYNHKKPYWCSGKFLVKWRASCLWALWSAWCGPDSPVPGPGHGVKEVAAPCTCDSFCTDYDWTTVSSHFPSVKWCSIHAAGSEEKRYQRETSISIAKKKTHNCQDQWSWVLTIIRRFW